MRLYKNIVLELPQIKSKTEEFNKSNNLSLTSENIVQVIKLWISGNLYKEISIKIGQEVDTIFKIIFFSNWISNPKYYFKHY